MENKRNLNLDMLRGMAAFSVISQHVLSKFNGFGECTLANINFSLENPLFMVVSGFALIYSKPIMTASDVQNYIIKRSLLILMPWAIWSFIKYLVFANNSLVEYFSDVAYHMEAAYWFLFSLWCMCLIYAFSCFVLRSYYKNHLLFFCGVSVLCLLISGMLMALAYKTVGISFLGIKFTTYYFPFFLFGWLIGILSSKKWKDSWIRGYSLSVMLGLLIYIVLIAHINLMEMPDSAAWLRMLISMMGSVTIIHFVFSIKYQDNNVCKAFVLGGRLSENSDIAI